MREGLVRATDAAIRAVAHPRFFDTELSFHGAFYHSLQTQLNQSEIQPAGSILEIEHQKSGRHGIRQRPDIILHVPAVHGVSVKDNNHAVWALKWRASVKKAKADFVLLDEMFEELNYPLGFFVNIGSMDPMLQHYGGKHRDRIVAVATTYGNGEPQVCWSVV